MDARLKLDACSDLPGFMKGDCFVTWHARYQRSVAYHEAGHAVAFIAADRVQFGGFESPFRTLAYVEARGAMGGEVGINRAFGDYSDFLGFAHPPLENIELGHPLGPSILAAMEGDILSYLAGPYAQIAFEQSCQPSRGMEKSARGIEQAQGDYAMAAGLRREICRISRRHRRCDVYEERARLFVSTCWPAIDELARKLLDVRYMEADEVYAIIRPHLSRPGRSNQAGAPLTSPAHEASLQL